MHNQMTHKPINGYNKDLGGRIIVRQWQNVTMVNADCLDCLPIKADAVITDPPYGMEWPADNTRFCGGSPESQRRRKGRGMTEKDGVIIGDDKPFDPTPWLEYPKVVLWGMHHYAARLPVGTVLVWVKRFEQAYGTFLSDADLAWMKGGHGVYCRQGPMPQSMAAERLHPTQKPVELMAWCLDKANVPAGATVLDPYAGSGSTAIACIRTGRKFVGVEKDPRHYKTACERIDRELSQGILLPVNG